MSIKPFAYARATSLHDAVTALDANTRPLAGGTDLIPLMKDGLAAPERLVALGAIPGLAQIAVVDEALRVGASATLANAALDPLVANSPGLGALKEALLEAASPQIRHMATLGGNLVQAPRCWYYRNAKTPCWRKGGRMCYAFRGENKGHVLFDGGPCYAVHPSDPAVALMALGASVTLVGPVNERDVPLAEFYHKPGRDDRSDNVLAEDELITAITVPLPPEGACGVYVKVAERQVWDFALVSAAVTLAWEEEAVSRASIALGGVAPYPWRVPAAEAALLGAPLSDESISAAAQAAAEGARTLEQNGYKVALIRGVMKEALGRLA